MHDEASSTPPAIAAETPRANRFRAIHALILLLEYVAAQYAGSLAAGFGFGVYISASHGGRASAEMLQASKPLIIAYGAIIGIPLGVMVVVLQTRYWAREMLADGSARGIAWTRPARPAWAPALIVGVVLAGFMVLVMARLVPPDPQALNGPLAQLAQGALFTRLVLVVLAVLVAPLIEEFLFRGAMFAAVARSWGAAAAAILTTLAFVAVHLPDKLHYWPGLVAVAVLALANCALRLRFRSLAPAIVTHFAYNISLLIFSAGLL